MTSHFGSIDAKGQMFRAYYTRHGRRHEAGHYFATRALARAWLAQERRLIDLDIWTPPAERRAADEQESVTFGEYARHWIDARQVRGRPLKAGTRQLYMRYLHRHLTEMDDLPLIDITRDDWNRWYADLTPGRDVERARCYAFVRSILATATDDGILQENPLKVRGAGGAGHDLTGTELFTAAQIGQLADAMRPEHRLAVLLAAWCGLRFGEVAGLQRGDFTLPKDKPGKLHVRRAVVTIGGAQRFDTTKTEGSTRDVPVPAFLVPEIRAHLKAHAQPGRNGLLFPGSDGGLITPGQLVGTRARKAGVNSKGHRVRARTSTGYYLAAEKVGRPDLSFHKLRHFFGTTLSAAGATMRETMAAMGHRTTSAAMRYQHAGDARLTELAGILDTVHDAAQASAADPSQGDRSVTDDPELIRLQIAALQARLDDLDRKDGDHE